MNDRLIRIRESEKKSHTEIYSKEKLYDTDSWLNSPIKTVRDISSLFSDYNRITILDLGSGIGRNSIYLADEFKTKECRIDCVDLLDVAIEKLNQNAIDYGVGNCINGIVESIETYPIVPNTYDLIMAISALEHVDCEATFVRKLEEIKHGIKDLGIVCLVLNTEIREINAVTSEVLDPQFEVNISSEDMNAIIEKIFSGWMIIKKTVVDQEYEIPRDGVISKLNTSVLTYVARKTMN